MNHFTASLLSRSLGDRVWRKLIMHTSGILIRDLWMDVRVPAVDGAACRGPDLWTTVLIVRSASERSQFAVCEPI